MKTLITIILSLSLIAPSASALTTESEGEGSLVACTKEYRPVCGLRDTGIRCITTPCPSTEEKTYSNSCMMKADNAELLYEGICKIETAPVTCKRWHDGCNMCHRSEVDGPLACTEMACEVNTPPSCKEYFEGETVADEEDEEEIKSLQQKIIDLLTKIINILTGEN